MEDKKIESEKSLELIEKMISSSQRQTNPYGAWHMMVWGYTVFFASVVVGLLYSFWNPRLCYFFWFLIPLIGFPVSYFIKQKEREIVWVKGYIDRMVASVGYVCNIAIFTIMIGAYFIWIPVFPIILLLSCVHCATVGLVTQFKIMTIMGIAGIFSSILFYIIPYSVVHIFLFGACYLLLYVIPGHCLNHLNKQRRA